jgi:hypothetical protein
MLSPQTLWHCPLCKVYPEAQPLQTELEVGHSTQKETVQLIGSQVRLFELAAYPEEQLWHPRESEQSAQLAIQTEHV